MIKEYRIKRLNKKLEERKAEFRYFSKNKRFLTNYEYETVMDIIYEEIMSIKKRLSRLERKK